MAEFEFSKKESEAVEQLSEGYKKIKGELSKVIVGQENVVEELLISIFARGHAILEGVPGLAKTLLISSLARCLTLSFNRIQFTPDLMPSDITGTEIIQEDKSTGTRSFKFLKGPIFANVILADEINRTPPKTQASLLEAMQERQVTVGGVRYPLDGPFFVLATQNPIEQEGTYPLPEAQQDRFFFKILVAYPNRDEELEIIRLNTTRSNKKINPVLSGEDILNLQGIVEGVFVADHVMKYAMDLVRMTRPLEGEAPDFIKEWVRWGAGPRASMYLVMGAKAKALINGQSHASTADIRTVAKPILRHRIITNYNAASEGITQDQIIDKLLDIAQDKIRKDGIDGRVQKVFTP